MEKNKQSHATMQLEDSSFDRVVTFIADHKLISQGSTIVLGLSGGPDSVFLLYVLLRLKKTGHIKQVIAAHLDHEWRSDSTQDMLFCKQLAQQHGIPFETKKIAELDLELKWNGSQEEIGRKARRFFFEKTQQKYSADLIALGHHLQDQQETFLMRLLRGSSLTGLCGMKLIHGAYVRPLLQMSKVEIIAYLEAHAISYLKDPSNKSDAFLRNRVRATVVPALKAADDRFDTTFTHTLSRLQEAEEYLDKHARELFASLSQRTNRSLEVFYQQLLKQPPIMQSRLIMQWLCQEKVTFPVTQRFIDEIIRFLANGQSQEHAIHPGWKITKYKKICSIVKSD